MSTSSRPGTTTAPSSSTCASSETRSEISMSVAERWSWPAGGAQHDPREDLDACVRVETPRPAS